MIKSSTRSSWNTINTTAFYSTLTAVVILFLFLANDDDKYLRILDDANLMFHEAGHPIFGLFGNTLGLYGGTLGQLFFPMVMVVSFWLKREPIGFTLGSIWFFQNFLNISRYMADARNQLLPLLGGGVHDWTSIFDRWGVLHIDFKIAHFFEVLGWIGMSLTLAWFYWVWMRQK